MPIEPALFRDALASWASGVTIVTAKHGDRVQGMTVSAFTSVCPDPPLILICAEKSSITNGIIQDGGAFSVSVLARDQDALSNRFASKKEEHRRFEGLDCADGRTGCPRIPGAIAWLDCSVVHTLDSGDHFIYVGEVAEAEVRGGEPLVYFRQRYASVS